MRVTAGGTRLISNMRTGMVASGKRYTRPSGLLPTPNIIWNGNPLCPPGAVLYLPGLPGSGISTYDYSGQKLIGVITGAAWTQLASGLWVLSFDGSDDRISIAANAALNNLSAYTILVWFNPSSVTGVRSLYDKRYPHLNLNGGGYLWSRRDTNETTASSQATNPLSINTWYQGAVTYDNNGDRKPYLYLDSVFIAQTQTAGTGTAYDDSINNILIGERVLDNTQDYAGLMGEVWVYPRILTPLEILNLFLVTKWRYQ